MGLKVELTRERAKLERQIAALEWQISQDTRTVDKAIHQEALAAMKEHLVRLEGGI